MHSATPYEQANMNLQAKWRMMEERIAELEAEVERERIGRASAESLYEMERDKEFEQAANETILPLRKLCGEAAKFFINTECGHFECHKCKNLYNCGLVEGEMVRKLRAAAEGGE